MISTVSSTIDQFNRRNIHILKSLGYQVTVISNFSDENPTSDDKKKKFV